MGKLKKNFAYQFIYQILLIVLPLITSPYISRVLGADGIGKYSYSYTVGNYFYIVCMLGFDTYGQRRIASEPDSRLKRDHIFTEIWMLQILVTSAVSVVYLLYCLYLNDDQKLLAFIQYMVVAASFFNIVWLFEGVEEFKGITIRNATVKIISCIMIFLLVKKQGDLWIYAFIMGGSALAGNIILLLYVKKYASFVKVKFSNIFCHLKPVFLLFISQIGITIFMQMDKLMLGWWSPISQLGYYQNAEKIISVPIAFILAIGTVMMPRIINLKTDGNEQLIRKYNLVSMELLMLLGMACAFGLSAISNDFTPWFFGNSFRECSKILSILSVQIIFMVWENVLQKQYLLPFGYDNVVARAMIMAAITNIIFNSLLIPKYGAYGAIIGSIISHFAICLYEGILLRKKLPIGRYFRESLMYLLNGTVMYLLVSYFSKRVYMENILLKIVLEIIIGAVIYVLGSMLILKLQNSYILDYCLLALKKGGKDG